MGSFAALFMVNSLFGQTPSDAVMMGRNVACVLLDYSHGHFDQYYEGSLLRENQTIATVSRQTALAMIVIGITDKLNVYAGLPYVKTKSSTPNGGKFAGANGLQDWSIAVKYKAVDKTIGNGELRILAAVDFSRPASNYLADYMPYSLGVGAPQLSYRGIYQYKYNSGLYLRTAGSYVWRGYSEAEREYYYNNGSYYTSWMDVPNAITVEGIVGKWFLENALQVELNFMSSTSLSGDDIRPYNAAQPTNKVNWSRAGIMAHYYFNQVPGLGVLSYYNRIIDGRNTAKMSTVGFGVTYFFNYSKTKS